MFFENSMFATKTAGKSLLVPQGRAKSAQEPPKSGQDRPKSAQDCPKSGPRALKTPKRPPKTPLRPVQNNQKSSKDTPKRPKIDPRPKQQKTATRQQRYAMQICFKDMQQRYAISDSPVMQLRFKDMPINARPQCLRASMPEWNWGPAA